MNWVHLLLPLGVALNWEIVLNLFIAWVSACSFGPGKRNCSLTASVAFRNLAHVCGMPYFLRIFAGHLAPLGAMAWIPWIFCSIDPGCRAADGAEYRWRRERSVEFQLLAGHPQTLVLYGDCGVCLFGVWVWAGIYLPPPLLVAREGSHSANWRRAAALVAVPFFAVALAAIQIFPGLAIVSETVRSAGEL